MADVDLVDVDAAARDVGDHTGREGSDGWVGPAFAVGAWLAIVVACRIVAESIMARDGFDSLRLGAAPLVGRQVGITSAWLLLTLLVGAALVMVLPRLVTRLRWGPLLVVVALATLGWVVVLNASRSGGLTRPLERPNDEYLVDVPAIETPHEFLTTYPDRIDDFAVHTRSHPPGFILLLWGLDELGLRGSGWAAALVVTAGGAAMAAVLIGVREVAGEARARRAAPFLVLAPVALWIGSSADALYAATAAVGVTALLRASGRSGRGAWAWAVAGGVALGVGLTFSYGLWLASLIAVPTLVQRRRLALVGPAFLGALVPLVALHQAGFRYLAGFAATRREVAESVQATRPLALFVVLNLAVLGIACGPAVVAGLAGLRDRATWLVVGGGLLAVAAADLSGLSKGEVERIWLPFTVWLLAAGSAHERHRHAWLATQVAFAVAIQGLVRTGW